MTRKSGKGRKTPQIRVLKKQATRPLRQWDHAGWARLYERLRKEKAGDFTHFIMELGGECGVSYNTMRRWRDPSHPGPTAGAYLSLIIYLVQEGVIPQFEDDDYPLTVIIQPESE